jgi:hypothetical protein
MWNVRESCAHRNQKRSLTAQLMLLATLAVLTPRQGAAQAAAYQVLYSFQGTPDGADPLAGLTIEPDGILLGTTNGGGASSLGTIFSLRPKAGSSTWKETVLYSFGGSDGESPQTALVPSGKGTYYGTTSAGGNGNNGGVIYEFAPPAAAGAPWTEAVLRSFPDYPRDTQDIVPNQVLVGPGGTLFTTTRGADGLVIALVPPAAPGVSWTQVQLYPFNSLVGNLPLAGVVSEGGSLFGTLYDGGAHGSGSVYELTPPTAQGGTWTETTLYSFVFWGPPFDGQQPAAPLTIGPNGVLYSMRRGCGKRAAAGGACLICGVRFDVRDCRRVHGSDRFESSVCAAGR